MKNGSTDCKYAHHIQYCYNCAVNSIWNIYGKGGLQNSAKCEKISVIGMFDKERKGSASLQYQRNSCIVIRKMIGF